MKGVVHLTRVEKTRIFVACTGKEAKSWDYGTLSEVTCPACLDLAGNARK